MTPHFLSRLKARCSEAGASAVEYGLLVAAIAALIVVIVFAFGGIVRDTFDKTCDTIAGTAQVTDNSCNN